MWFTILKAVGTVVVVVLISEVAKRSNMLGAAIAALPLMTMLVVANLASDPKSGVAGANAFAWSTFLLFWPGLAFFILLPVAQRFGAPFWVAFALSVAITGGATWGFIAMAKTMGLKL